MTGAPAVLYRGARLIDATGAAPRERADVLVRGATIERVGSGLDADGADTVDCAGRTLLPGLVNADDYLAMRGFSGKYYDVYRQSSHWQLLRAARNALASLAQGITSVRDVGSQDATVLVLRDAIRADMIVGPHVYACGTPLCPTFEGPGVEPVGMTVEAADADALVAGVESLLARGADFVMIKMHREDFELRRKRHFTVDEVRPAVERARAAGVTVGATAPDTFAMRRAVEAGIRAFGSGRAVADDEGLPRALADAGAMLAPNLAGWARNERWATEANRARHVAGVRRCAEAGVALATGTTYYGESLVDEIVAFRRDLGLSPMESIRAATVNGARMLGREAEFGTIEAGKRADLVLVDGDPLADPEVLRRPSLVVRAGRAFRPEALAQAIGSATVIPA